MPLPLAAFLAAAAVAAAPPPKEVSPLVVTPPPGAPRPDVTLQISADEEGPGRDVAIWPAAAREAGLGGYATLACQVDVHGLAVSCRVVFEAPPGKGFGAAALALRPIFKLAPRQGPDGPVDSEMKIAVSFKAPEVQTNLHELAAAAAPPDAVLTGGELGRLGMNGGHLITARNPVQMRPLTMMTEPAWAEAPGFAEWAAAYPAAGGGLEGYAVAHCKVDRTGALSRCAVAKEVPEGHGFGKAAVALAARFRASPQAMASAPRGAPVEVDVPVRFPPPAQAAERTVRAPVWIVGADPESLARELPPPAQGRNPGPGAVVQCQVDERGALGGCAIEYTSPDGLEFDEAAVRLASRLRMNLWSGDAGPVRGGTIHLPIRGPGAEQAKR